MCLSPCFSISGGGWCWLLAGRVCCTRDAAAASHWSAARGHRDTATLPIGREPGDTLPLVERVVTLPIGRRWTRVVTPRQLEGWRGHCLHSAYLSV